MLSREENELITRVAPGTPMGNAMRRYWIPALLAREIAAPDCPPVRVRLLGEDLVAFRDTEGRIGQRSEARTLYHEVSTRFADTPFADEASTLLKRGSADSDFESDPPESGK